MKKKSSTIDGDIPWRSLSEFSVELSEPLSNVFNSALISGLWPDSWKHEQDRQVPKVHIPCTVNNLRRISGTKNLSKLFEVLLVDTIIHDMASYIDPAQFGNEKGLPCENY